jgi:hypothetical protein
MTRGAGQSVAGEEPDRWGPGVSGKGSGRRTPSGKIPGWVMGWMLAWARMLPRSLFRFFLFLSFLICFEF